MKYSCSFWSTFFFLLEIHRVTAVEKQQENCLKLNMNIFNDNQTTLHLKTSHIARSLNALGGPSIQIMSWYMEMAEGGTGWFNSRSPDFSDCLVGERRVCTGLPAQSSLWIVRAREFPLSLFISLIILGLPCQQPENRIVDSWRSPGNIPEKCCCWEMQLDCFLFFALISWGLCRSNKWKLYNVHRGITAGEQCWASGERKGS